MTRELTGKPAHRPQKEIDWAKVEECLCADLTGVEIAAIFDLHPETFYVRVQKEYGIGFTGLSREKRDKGNGFLKLVQYRKALKGHTAELKWLAVNRLNQKEKLDNNDLPPNDGAITILLNDIKATKESPNGIESEADPQF